LILTYIRQRSVIARVAKQSHMALPNEIATICLANLAMTIVTKTLCKLDNIS
jgi:hypothetical protein